MSKDKVSATTILLFYFRCNGVLEGIRICRQGYPNRLPFEDFVLRYRFILPFLELEPNREGARDLCERLGLDPTVVQIGNTKVFCKVGVISEVTRFMSFFRSKKKFSLKAIKIQW